MPSELALSGKLHYQDENIHIECDHGARATAASAMSSKKLNVSCGYIEQRHRCGLKREGADPEAEKRYAALLDKLSDPGNLSLEDLTEKQTSE